MIIYNGEVSALAAGALGDDAAVGLASHRQAPRSLSAVTYTGRTRTSGFPLAHHTVFFSRDYAAEFDAISHSGTPGADPTIYICAQDRSDAGALSPAETDGERLLMLINARADGDRTGYNEATADAIKENVECRLRASGWNWPGGLDEHDAADFETAFPGSGGALYAARSRASWRHSSARGTNEDSGTVSGGRRRSSGGGRADGGNVRSPGRDRGHDRPYFDVTVPDRGYHWWYRRSSDDGRAGIQSSLSSAASFPPITQAHVDAAAAHPESPRDHVALYGPERDHWAMTETVVATSRELETVLRSAQQRQLRG